ncbi:hypothetical protein BJY00DRAFT_300027 [Aspergillus carlsbadensis]|nr:hypothetical protein BJY00DRAFT_300027 [Aspergillus carlsbadensis]
MSAPEPIAIVGLSCRFPGGADTPDKLWDIISSKQQCWTPVPPSRYNEDAFYHPDPDAKGTHNARGGFFLTQDVAAFDAPFFGIPAAEASAMDPQQRLLLEVTYEALESAGQTLNSVRGTQTGVYVALVSRDYDRHIYKDPMRIPKHHLTGCGDATACGRISYVFDLRGPSMALDTGCSGGMVALHLACQALRAGEVDAAIIGGTNLLLGPDMTIAMSALHMINDNGRCYPFDSRGAGYGRAEGVAALVVKRLSDALRDGDPIRAVVRNSGVNQDGKTNGILLPSSDAQRDLAASLYRQAGLNPAHVSYIEAHGTGTQAGDAAEVTSIKAVFTGDAGQREHPLFIGSIKANIGHSESTSGLAGVIKAVLALEKGAIPPLAGLEQLKPDLVPLLEGSGIVIPQEPYPWPHQGIRLASVNSFGFGGTNSHVILQSAPETLSNGSTEIDVGQKEPLLFVLSAKSKSSLEKTIRNLRDWTLKHQPTYSQRHALAQTLAYRRSTFKWRSTITAPSTQGLLAALNEPRLGKVLANPQVAFIFTGQGAQYAMMGRELIHQDSSFSHSIHMSQRILQDLGASWSLRDELLRDETESRIDSSELSQPATTAIQIALVDMLTELNVRPSVVLGHSSGEVAAAYAAGILTHVEALTIAYHKGFVASWCRETTLPKGAMLAVGLGEAEALEYVQRGQMGKCTVACINSPSSVTLSGDELAIAEAQKLLNKDSVFNRRLKVDIAYHSHHMAAVSDRFYNCIRSLSPRGANESVCFFSSVAGLQITEPLGASYWVDNLVSQVRFAPALEEMARVYSKLALENLVLLEIGPHSALQGLIRQIMMNGAPNHPAKWTYVPSLTRNKDAHVAALEMVGSLFEQGVCVGPTTDLSSHPNTGIHSQAPMVTTLSPYPWDHSPSNHYWHESRLSKEYRFRSHPPHDLCGLRLTGTSTIEPVFRHILSVDDLPWLQEHIIDGFALYPGSAFLCMGIEALRQVLRDRGEKRQIARYVFKDVSFSKALVVPDSPGSVEALLSFRPSRGEWEEFRITSVGTEGGWSEHCKGNIRAEFRAPAVENEDKINPQGSPTSIAEKHLDSMRQTCQETLPSTSIYTEMRNNGIDYGDSFTIIQEMHLADHKGIGHLRIPDIKRTMPSQHMQPHVIHPAVFDAFMHVVLPLYHRHCSQGPVMLTSIGEVSVSADILNTPGDELVAACELTRAARRHGSVDVTIYQFDSEGKPVERRESPVDHEYVYRDGRLVVPRLEQDTPANQWLRANITGENIMTTAEFHGTAEPLELHFTTPGLFDSAVFAPVAGTPGSLGPDEVSVKLYAHGVNALDVSIALDRADPTATMMGEFAGVVLEPGDRVCGWGARPYTNKALVKRHLVQKIDKTISFTEGASIPVALEEGQSAAISIAQNIGAEAYATVESQKEKELLVEQAGIPKGRAFLSSSTTIKAAILHLTGSNGGLIDESVPLVADFGYALSTRLERNVTFASVNLQLLAAWRPNQVESLFSKLMTLCHAGKLRPIACLATMSLADISTAFRLVQSQRYSGKIVLENDDTTVVKQVAPRPRPPVMAEDGVYVAIGGNAALNHALCAFLKERGARRILSVMEVSYTSSGYPKDAQ